MAFQNNIRLPTAIGLDLRIEARRAADPVVTRGKKRYPNLRWSQSQRRYDFTFGPKIFADLKVFTDVWEAVGFAHSFRFKDPYDYSTAASGAAIANNDVTLGTGDGAATTFQLVVPTTAGSLTHNRVIRAPVSGTVLVALDGVTAVETTDYSIDYSSGVVTFVGAPGLGVVVTAGFEYDVPVFFDEDVMGLQFVTPKIGSVANIALVEDQN